ncbi:MAG: hypothetical protein SNJ75_00475 [Gemmataceae bacterium]
MSIALCLALLLPAQTVWAAKGQPSISTPVIATSPATSSSGMGPSRSSAVYFGETVLTIPLDTPLGVPDDGLRPRLGVALTQAPRPLPVEVVQQALAQQTAPASSSSSTSAQPGPLAPVSLVNPTPIPQTTPRPMPPALEGLQMRVNLPPRVLQDQPVACEIHLQTGEQALVGVQIEAALPAGCRVLASEPTVAAIPQVLRWEIGHLPAQSKRTLRAELLPSQGTELLVQPQARFSLAQAARSEILLPPIGLRIEAPQSVGLGEVLSVKLHIQNNTPSTLRRIRLSCQLPEGLRHAQGKQLSAELSNDLPPGQSRCEELSLRAQAGGSQSLQIHLQADGGLHTQQRTTIDVQAPLVSVQVQTPRRVRTGEEFTVRLLVANPSQQETPPLRVFLALPDGVQFVSAGEKGQMHPAGSCLYWTLDRLAANGLQAVTATLRGHRGGDWALRGIVQGPGLREVRTTQAVLIEETPKLTLELTRLEDPLALDSETIYTLRIYNPGALVVQNVQAVIDLPPELLPVQAEGPARWRISGQRVLFEPLARLPARMDAIFQVRVRAVRSGVGGVRGALTAQGLPGVLQREVAAHVK